MRTITTSYNVYKYNELSEEAKEKVKEWYLRGQETYIFTENCEQDLRNLFGENELEVQYSLNYCQGDGLNIYGTIHARDIINCLEKHNGGTQLEDYEDVLTAEEKKTILRYAEEIDDLIELPYNNRYCYSLAYRISFAEDWEEELEYYSENVDGTLIKKFEMMVQEIFTTLCKGYEVQGYEYFYEISDEDLEEICEVNEWEFLENGRVV